MPIVSDRLVIKEFIYQLLITSPNLSKLQATETILRSFYDLTSSDSIWSGSDAAICLGYRDELPNVDLFERIVEELAEEV